MTHRSSCRLALGCLLTALAVCGCGGDRGENAASPDGAASGGANTARQPDAHSLTSLAGTVWSGRLEPTEADRQRGPMILVITEQADGKLHGTVEWPGIDARNEFTGSVQKDKVFFEEQRQGLQPAMAGMGMGMGERDGSAGQERTRTYECKYEATVSGDQMTGKVRPVTEDEDDYRDQQGPSFRIEKVSQTEPPILADTVWVGTCGSSGQSTAGAMEGDSYGGGFGGSGGGMGEYGEGYGQSGVYGDDRSGEGGYGMGGMGGTMLGGQRPTTGAHGPGPPPSGGRMILAIGQVSGGRIEAKVQWPEFGTQADLHGQVASDKKTIFLEESSNQDANIAGPAGGRDVFRYTLARNGDEKSQWKLTGTWRRKSEAGVWLAPGQIELKHAQGGAADIQLAGTIWAGQVELPEKKKPDKERPYPNRPDGPPPAFSDGYQQLPERPPRLGPGMGGYPGGMGSEYGAYEEHEGYGEEYSSEYGRMTPGGMMGQSYGPPTRRGRVILVIDKVSEGKIEGSLQWPDVGEQNPCHGLVCLDGETISLTEERTAVGAVMGYDGSSTAAPPQKSQYHYQLTIQGDQMEGDSAPTTSGGYPPPSPESKARLTLRRAQMKTVPLAGTVWEGEFKMAVRQEVPDGALPQSEPTERMILSIDKQSGMKLGGAVDWPGRLQRIACSGFVSADGTTLCFSEEYRARAVELAYPVSTYSAKLASGVKEATGSCKAGPGAGRQFELRSIKVEPVNFSNTLWMGESKSTPQAGGPGAMPGLDGYGQMESEYGMEGYGMEEEEYDADMDEGMTMQPGFEGPGPNVARRRQMVLAVKWACQARIVGTLQWPERRATHSISGGVYRDGKTIGFTEEKTNYKYSAEVKGESMEVSYLGPNGPVDFSLTKVPADRLRVDLNGTSWRGTAPGQPSAETEDEAPRASQKRRIMVLNILREDNGHIEGKVRIQGSKKDADCRGYCSADGSSVEFEYTETIANDSGGYGGVYGEEGMMYGGEEMGEMSVGYGSPWKCRVKIEGPQMIGTAQGPDGQEQRLLLRSSAPPPSIRVIDPWDGVAFVNKLTELDAILRKPGTARVIWVRMPRQSLPSSFVASLRQFVSNGSVVWTDTDLAQVGGFVGLATASEPELQGTARFTSGDCPAVLGLSQKTVPYQLSPTACVVRLAQAPAARPKGLMPLVESPQGAFAVSAIQTNGRGMFVLLPFMLARGDASRVFEPQGRLTSGGGEAEVVQRFLSNLRSYSLAVAAKRLAPP